MIQHRKYTFTDDHGRWTVGCCSQCYLHFELGSVSCVAKRAMDRSTQANLPCNPVQSLQHRHGKMGCVRGDQVKDVSCNLANARASSFIYMYIYCFGFPMITKVVPQTRDKLYKQQRGPPERNPGGFPKTAQKCTTKTISMRGTNGNRLQSKPQIKHKHTHTKYN